MRRFTLVEMMIVVAIVMVLAAIAIPALNTYQLSAKRAEMPTNLDGITTAWIGYQTAAGGSTTLASLVANPDLTPSKTARAWVTSNSDWNELGWKPDGSIRATYDGQVSTCRYIVDGISVNCNLSFTCFHAYTELDGDGRRACYESKVRVTLGDISTTPSIYEEDEY